MLEENYMLELSKKVKNLFLIKTAKENRELSKDFDIVEMPIEGVVAYWLSLKKILGNKKITRYWNRK